MCSGSASRGGDHLGGQPVGELPVAGERAGRADEREEADRAVPPPGGHVLLELANGAQHGVLA